MKTIAFILSMPNVGSWDGKWSAAKDVHCIIKTLKNQDVDKLFDKMPRQERNFYYNFGDGWSANVKVIPIGPEHRKYLEKNNKGFCGYDWMVDSILKHGKIICN